MTNLDQKWDALVNNPEIPIAEYLENEKALQEREGEKLNRLAIMTRAQRTRAWFLGLSMADRKIFLEVLTADDDGAIAKLFALQAKVESKVDDAYLEAVKPGVFAPPRDGKPDVVKAYTALNRVVAKQGRARERKQKLASGSRAALPTPSVLRLPGAKP